MLLCNLSKYPLATAEVPTQVQGPLVGNLCPLLGLSFREPSAPLKTSSEGQAISSSYDTLTWGWIEMLHTCPPSTPLPLPSYLILLHFYSILDNLSSHLLPPSRDICMHACIHEWVLNLNMFFTVNNSHWYTANAGQEERNRDRGEERETLCALCMNSS